MSIFVKQTFLLFGKILLTSIGPTSMILFTNDFGDDVLVFMAILAVLILNVMYNSGENLSFQYLQL